MTGSRVIKIEVDENVWVVTFSANGKYLVSGGQNGVRLWQGNHMAAMMKAEGVHSIAVSKDGRWVAAGTTEGLGSMHVWDTTTHEQVFVDRKNGGYYFHGVDFSPDSTKLVAASSDNTATVFDLTTRRQTRVFRHTNSVIAAKYSPQGERLATATYQGSVRLWDSNDGSALVDIPATVTPWQNAGLLWSDNHLFVVSHGVIKEFDTVTGSSVSECAVRPLAKGCHACIALPKHKGFIVYATRRTVTLWDTETHSKISQIHYPQDIFSVAISPDDQSIAIGGQLGRVRIEALPGIPVGIFEIDHNVLDIWEQDRLDDADALLTAAIPASKNPHSIFANRAVIRTRLKKWELALVDAEKSLDYRASAVGYIAKSLAHVGNRDKHKAYQACDTAFGYLDSSYVTLLRLVKTTVMFMAGERADAMSRMDDLIATAPSNSECHVVQAYMHLLVGSSHMESSNYKAAIDSFVHARSKLPPSQTRSLLMVSLITGWKFDHLDFTTRQRLCEAFYAAGRIGDAIETFRQLTNDWGDETRLQRERREWAIDFPQRSWKVGEFGDAAVLEKRYDEAISHYSAALSLCPPSPQDIHIKRSQACAAAGYWNRALDDANQAIALDPMSPWGYGAKREALHKAGDYENAVMAFEEMLSKIEQSSDPGVQRLHVPPSNTRAAIRTAVQNMTHRLPRELINTTNGRLYNRANLEAAFHSSAICQELVFSMSKRIDYVRIKREVRQYFRYIMLSHNWEPDEPLFQDVAHASVYDLGQSKTHDKLQTFCKIVRDGGFMWAWSDTCCINKSDNFVLQEALVAMFKWYEGSALTIVYLRGVPSSSRFGALVRSIWNTRAWTLQEYIAAKIVHFYTEDWKLYLELQLRNHKESPEVISEMEEATGVSSKDLMALRPGLGNIREKLRLASTRKTTLVEDEGYSLLGIFSASGVPTIYGEGENALGRLLANIITRSGDVGVLAWTGDSGPFNSCLPAHLSVFNGPVTSHLPAYITDTEMDAITTTLRGSSFDRNAALRLYDRLRDLPSPRFAESRMTLPCMTFRLPRLSLFDVVGAIRVYHAKTDPFGMVEIRTKYDLTRFGQLYLVHPWLGGLLESEDGVFGEDNVMPPPSPHTDDEKDDEVDDEIYESDNETNDGDEFYDCFPHPELPSPSLSAPSPVRTVPMDRETRASRLVARLRQPFGALLFKLTAVGQRIQGYKRVAADSAINVRFREDFPLAHVLDRVHTLDVL